jgi:hypothetical protein
VSMQDVSLSPVSMGVRTSSAVPAFLFLVIAGAGAALAYGSFAASGNLGSLWIAVAAFVVALIVGAAVKVAAQWDRAVVLRLGRFQTLRGPGLFVIVPIVDVVANWIDTRVITSTFKAEKTLTRDTPESRVNPRIIDLLKGSSTGPTSHRSTSRALRSHVPPSDNRCPRGQSRPTQANGRPLPQSGLLTGQFLTPL